MLCFEEFEKLFMESDEEVRSSVKKVLIEGLLLSEYQEKHSYKAHTIQKPSHSQCSSL